MKKQISTAHLTKLQRRVTLENGTEPPFENEYWNHEQIGLYVDVIDGTPLFTSLAKFDAGCGWPSFAQPLEPHHLTTTEDRSLGIVRTEVRSTSSDAHLGHVFHDGPVELGGLRFCMNSAALRFVPYENLEQEGYAEYITLFQLPSQKKISK